LCLLEQCLDPVFRTSIKTRNFVTFYKFLIHVGMHHTKSNHKPTTYPTKYLRQYLADEDISSHHPLRMYGGQMPVLYGCTYLLSWGQRSMVKQLITKKTNILC
jgi:hypothetical protein